MEGCSVEYMEDGEVNMEFHTHFADKSDQNAASTHAHMEVLIGNLLARNKLSKDKSTIWEFTDGCKKQYRCNVVMYFLSYLAAVHGITIDRQVDAPGHGKGVVDGINAIDKNYLSKMMSLTMTPEVITEKDRMSSATMIEGAEKSFARECIRLCSNPERKNGVKSDKKSVKRESSAKLKERFYHLQEHEEVKYKGKKVALEGFKDGPREGISSMYNIRADPDLGFGKVAIRRIPCACNSCVGQLKNPWVPGKSAEEQDRYMVNKNCKYWSIFEGTNDWKIITCKEVKNSPRDECKDLEQAVLIKYADRMSETLAEGNIGAFLTEANDTDGYYIVTWTSTPYTLQEDEKCMAYDPPMLIKKGTLVCDAVYHNKVPNAKYWYTPSTIKTIVRLGQVIMNDITVLPISDDNKLPRRMAKQIKQDCKRKNAKRLSNDDVDFINDEVYRRNQIEIIEDTTGYNFDMTDDDMSVETIDCEVNY